MDLAHELKIVQVQFFLFLDVSILVLMDLAHESKQQRDFNSINFVSILVLMDLAHEL